MHSLPAQCWHGHAAWRIDLPQWNALTFLRLWAAWRADPQRPAQLYVLTQSDRPPVVDAVRHCADDHPELRPLADELAQHCWGLLPGMHRLRFGSGDQRLHLTLRIAQVPEASTPDITATPCNTPDGPKTVTVIGAGLAGAGCARALAERGWQVIVLDAGAVPAAGASGLPVGLVAPHTSPDDSVVSRLSRAGVRCMRDAMSRLLQEGSDWGASGVQERRLPGKTRKGGAPQSWSQEWAVEGAIWTRPADPPAPDNALWHSQGAWLRPARLVQALLDHPNIRWQGQAWVDTLRRSDRQWQAWQGDTLLAESARIVLAVGPGTTRLVSACLGDAAGLPIQPLRGQLSWGLMAETPALNQDNAPLPTSPVNGNGCFVHGVSTDDGPAWFAGSTFDRTRDQAVLLDTDHQENFERLQALLPETAAALAKAFGHQASVRGWAAVRCSVPDRLPMVGPVPQAPQGLWLCTAMGSRGLTLAVLCGELLAAQWHGEPLPIEERLAKALDAQRFIRTA